MKLFNSKLNKKLQEFVNDFNKELDEVNLKINAIEEYLGIEFIQKIIYPKTNIIASTSIRNFLTKRILVAKKKDDDKKEEILGTVNGVQVTQSDIDVLIKCKMPLNFIYEDSNKKKNKDSKK